jgi:two-component system, NarL family, invasion response regulator UvrY
MTATSSPVVEHAPVRVMTVDDQPVFRAVAHELFEAMREFEPVLEVASGQEALEAAGRVRAQMVLLDVRMPGMSGIETCRRLTAGDPSIVVVLITSGECADVARAARSCGAAALLAKQNINPAVLRGIWTLRGPV